ncbi:CzcE family metal-binding protein [Ramlibacter sp.]|uniref:CzcE family metal-binding protein n=1 Tax=Ramlibacter sp. TaxID=1917967 RepID=UPI0026029B96|nr:CzcE family metal-binding protein [Ramlibacter sp.]MDB5955283.1 CzcE family metal-binding protein [Ramlibacter sp.]
MKPHLLPLSTLGLLAAMAAHAAVPTRLLGDVVPAGLATRTIQITAATRYVNVKHGDAVRFVDDGRQFAYFFDGATGESSFDLRQVAPAGILDHRVTAYVEPDPRYWSP